MPTVLDIDLGQLALTVVTSSTLPKPQRLLFNVYLMYMGLATHIGWLSNPLVLSLALRMRLCTSVSCVFVLLRCTTPVNPIQKLALQLTDWSEGQ